MILASVDCKVPKDIENLPDVYQRRLAESGVLIEGCVSASPDYALFKGSMEAAISSTIEKMHGILHLTSKYQEVSHSIDEMISIIDILYKDFINFETYQYQLMSANFNFGFLRNKLNKRIETDKRTEVHYFIEPNESQEIAIHNVLKSFKSNRKAHHLRNEKLQRWSEDRVSGLA